MESSEKKYHDRYDLRGLAIRLALEELRIPNKEAATRSGLSVTTIYLWQTGEQKISHGKFRKFLDGMKWSPEFFGRFLVQALFLAYGYGKGVRLESSFKGWALEVRYLLEGHAEELGTDFIFRRENLDRSESSGVASIRMLEGVEREIKEKCNVEPEWSRSIFADSDEPSDGGDEAEASQDPDPRREA